MDSATPSRLVRVFISSTFCDFMGERDELVKKVFPELRRRCRMRLVELLEVDLRWGITEEQSQQGATLKICLKEIDRCRPSEAVFFIGLLGERYGWVPPKDYYPKDLLEDPEFAWVRQHSGGRSVTELEILHGVLNNPAMEGRAFFYFRNEGYERRHWEAIRAAYPDLRPEDFTNERVENQTPEDARTRQSELKARVVRAGLKHAPKNYETPQDLARDVLEMLWSKIDAAFPASEVPDALEQESLDHRIFGENRARAYVERPGLFEGLDAHAGGEGPLGRVVIGSPGSGKSALLAAWVRRQGERVVFHHFVGATPQSVNAEGILQRFFGELRRRGIIDRDEPRPANLDALAAGVPVWLEKLSDAGGGIILIDALNQLGSARDRELTWWPKEWPENVRLVFSTLPGEVWRKMEQRGWTAEGWCLSVPPLQPDEKRAVMNNYLALFARELPRALQSTILAAPQTTNPLFLRTVLDELRLRSRHEELSPNLETMLRCEDPAALFVHVLKNLERDFTPPESPGLVHRALGLMGTARRGLSESELLELLSNATLPSREPLPRHYWSPLYLALEDSLVSREGQLSFFHDYLREAVAREYLDEAHEREAAHGRLAQTVTRWREEAAFGATLRTYGFQQGITHLLEVDRTREAVELLLAEDYRETAARTLRETQPVLRDVERVRVAAAIAGTSDPEDAAALTVLALAGREQLTACLRQALDQAATQGHWESVMALSEAAEEETLRLLLACRAIMGGGPPGEESEARLLRDKMARWADGRKEWLELLGWMLPNRRETKIKSQTE
jgi:nephrocystin-3